jgi:enediyne biosynthesis protein E4
MRQSCRQSAAGTVCFSLSLPLLARLSLLLLTLTAGYPLVAGQRAGGSAGPPDVSFTDVTVSANVVFTPINGASEQKHLPETMGSGGAFVDLDADGWVDIVLVDGGSMADPKVAARAQHRILRNRRNGTFEDVTAASGIRHRDYGMGVCAGDYDDDGDVDLYLTNVGPNLLYENRGDGKFADTTASARVAGTGWSTSCAFADLDLDGDLDLFVVNYVDVSRPEPFCGDERAKRRAYCHPLALPPLPNTVFRNDGGGVFADVSESAGVARHRSNGLGVVISDLDGDRLPDVFVANDSLPNYLFVNTGGWKLSEAALLAGVAVADDGKARAGMGTDTGDYDGDGLLDLVVTNHEFEMTSLYRNLGKRLFAYATRDSGVAAPTRPYVGFGVALLDYDNDTRLDIAIANGHVMDNTTLFRQGSTHAQPNLLLRNEDGRRFRGAGVLPTAGGAGSATPHKVSRGLAAADYDNDGDLDLLVTNNGDRVDLLRNDGGHRRHALLIQLVARSSAPNGIGARVVATAGSRTLVRDVKAGSSYLSQHDTRVHIGLDLADVVERLEVQWPAGTTEVFRNVPANQILTIREGSGIVARQPLNRP